MLNQITLMGRLTRDPELRKTENHNAVANFSLAVDRDIKTKDGERVTDFIDCVAWSHTANFVSKYCAKGALVTVTGRLEIRDWTDKDGNKRRTAEVNVGSLYFAEKKNGNSADSVGDKSAPAANTAPTVLADDGADPEDLPF